MLDIDSFLDSRVLFQTTLPMGYRFVWRLLSLKEYQVLKALRDGQGIPEYIIAEEAFERCISIDAAYLADDLPAGISTSIGRLIMWLSGDCDSQTVRQDLHIARNVFTCTSTIDHMKMVVCLAFPTYTWDELDAWDRQKLIRLFTISENKLVKSGSGYEPLDLEAIRLPHEVEEVVEEPSPNKQGQLSEEQLRQLAKAASREALRR